MQSKQPLCPLMQHIVQRLACSLLLTFPVPFLRPCPTSLLAALELGAQIKLVATCGTVAFFLDAVTIVLDVLVLLKMSCDPTDDVCTALTNYALGFALFCVQHGVISYMVSQRASKIMPLLNPVTSGLVQL
jgi:hypothetical protein